MSKIEQKKYNVDIVEKQPLYQIRKVVDNYEEKGSYHPNGIDNGYTVKGIFETLPTIGKRFVIRGRHYSEYLDTSPVTEIVSDTIFKTKNSTYELTKLDEFI